MRRATRRASRQQPAGEISIHALLAESDQYHIFEDTSGATFLSTLSLRRATIRHRIHRQFPRHFYPRSPCGERQPWGPRPQPPQGDFYPRSPCGERLTQEVTTMATPKFLSTLSLRRATCWQWLHSLPIRISIHALLAESDMCSLWMSTRLILFLSTLSLRRATSKRLCQPEYIQISIHALLAESDELNSSWISSIRNFYPRSPCGERPETAKTSNADIIFLSTLSLRRATVIAPMWGHGFTNFYPRSPCGERLCWQWLHSLPIRISIHALLAESDICTSIEIASNFYFYPRSPCGERLINNVINGINKIFLSTLSLRRATHGARVRDFPLKISIHALLAESDDMYQYRNCE